MPDPAPPHLSVQLRHRISALNIDVAFQLTQPWTILFGPSGSGKTTILRAIAGLIRPDSARIVCNRSPVAQLRTRYLLVDTNAGIWVPAHKRGIPLAPQRPSLFPHMTVLQNLRYVYPSAVVRSPAEDDYRDSLLSEVPRLFQIESVLHKRPAELSGGEAQRINLARIAMCRRTRLRLLDEPFTGLDNSLRDLLINNLLPSRSEGRHLPVLSVTHDIAEAFQLNAEVIKLREGRIVAQGPAATVLAEERARLLAQLTQPAETPA